MILRIIYSAGKERKITWYIFLTILVLISGCSRSRGDVRLQLYSFVHENAATAIDHLLMNDVELQLMSVEYGPEWQTLDIYDRRLDDGELVCTYFKNIPFHEQQVVEGEIMYKTTNAAAVSQFERICKTLAQDDDDGLDLAAHPSSNPIIRAHILVPDMHVVIIREPWSLKGIDWLANNIVLLRSFVGDDDGIGRASLNEWVDVDATVRFDLGMKLLEFSTERVVSTSLLLEYYDLVQRAEYTLIQRN